ncbi:hypothetical protein HOLleu_24027 [Holothuria leucospilota]|uniref:Uncharacterized protein n=1 Tax=Holothuria leucospilota TaxID=206669 RepID=A0A9Q1BVV6_HOLLE|nr:hypothetical protein HOLleu_24027 [Holothuria leucospilota]
MKLTWKNYAHDAFRIVAILHICSAVRGESSVNDTMPDMITQNTSTDQAATSQRVTLTTVTTPQDGAATTITVNRSLTTKAATSSRAMTVTSESTGDKTTNTTNGMSASSSEDPQNTSTTLSIEVTSKPAPTPTPTKDNTSMIIIIIVVVAAIIVIFIAIVTAAYLCCCKGNGGDPKGYSSPESNGKVNGVAKDELPSGHRLSNEINKYENVNEKEQIEKSSPSVDKPSVTDPHCYSNEGLTGEDGKYYVITTSDERSPLAETSTANTGNIFDDIDPTTNKFKEQIELSPSESPRSASTSEEERISEPPKSATGQLTDKGRETVTPPKPVVRRNISNRNDNITKLRPKPQPRVRPVSRALQDGAGTAKDNTSPGNEPRDPSTGAEPPSSPSHQEKQRMFRPPLKGKGPDGSDQAALLANVLRKSNAPRQIEEDNSGSVDKEEGTTYW